MARVSLINLIYQPGLESLRKALGGTSLNSAQVTDLLRKLDSGNILFVAYSIAANSSPNNIEQAAKNLIPILITSLQYAQWVDQIEPNIVPAAIENLNRYVDTNGPAEIYQKFSEEYPSDQISRPENYETIDGKPNPLLDEMKKKLKQEGKEKLREIWKNFRKSPTGEAVEEHLTTITTSEIPTTAIEVAGPVTITSGEEVGLVATGAAAGALITAPHIVTPTSALAIRLQPGIIPPSGPIPPPAGAISGKIVGFSVRADLPASGLSIPEYLSSGILKEVSGPAVFKTFGLNAVEGVQYLGITEKGAMLATKIPQIGSVLGSYIPGATGVTTLVATPTSTIAVSGISTAGGITIGTATTVGTGVVTAVGTGVTVAGTGATIAGTGAVAAVGTGAVVAGATAATATAGVAGGAAAGAAAGAPTGPGAIITAVIGAIIGAVLSLIPAVYKKTKDYLEALSGGALVVFFGLFSGIGILPALALGGATTGFLAITNLSIVGAVTGLISSLANITTGIGIGTVIGLFIVAIATPIILTLIIFFVNTGGFVTPQAPAAFFDPGGGFADPSSCPLSGGVVSLGSYDPTNENNRAGGHGSGYYWDTVYWGSCYHIPQASGCFASSPPDSSRCNQPGISPTCSEYGYAADIFSSDTRIILPLVDGQSRDWSCSYGFANGSVGDTVYCNTTSGSPSVHLVLTHVIADPGFSANGPSGTVITGLFDQGGNTHLHLEAQVDGLWVRPENYFCGGS